MKKRPACRALFRCPAALWGNALPPALFFEIETVKNDEYRRSFWVVLKTAIKQKERALKFIKARSSLVDMVKMAGKFTVFSLGRLHQSCCQL